MATKIQKSKAQGKRTRARRYGSMEELREAVRLGCIAEIEQAHGQWTEERQARLLRDTRVSADGTRVWKQLREAIADVEAYGKSLPTSEDMSLGEWAVHAFLSRIRPIFRGLAATGPTDMNRRTLICGCYSMGDNWLFKDTPTDREIAIISLLAGEFPDAAKRKQEAGGDTPTVADVIEDETKATRLARGRWNRFFCAPRPRPVE